MLRRTGISLLFLFIINIGQSQNTSTANSQPKKSGLLKFLGKVANVVVSNTLTTATNSSSSTTNTSTAPINPHTGTYGNNSTSTISPTNGKYENTNTPNRSPTNNNYTNNNSANTNQTSNSNRNWATPVELSKPIDNWSHPVELSKPIENFTTPKELSKPIDNWSHPVELSKPIENFTTPKELSKPIDNWSHPVELSKPIENFTTPKELSKPIDNWSHPVELSKPIENFTTPKELSKPIDNWSHPVELSKPIENFTTPKELSKPIDNWSHPVELSKPIENFTTPKELSKPIDNWSHPVELSTPVLSTKLIELSTSVQVSRSVQQANNAIPLSNHYDELIPRAWNAMKFNIPNSFNTALITTAKQFIGPNGPVSMTKNALQGIGTGSVEFVKSIYSTFTNPQTYYNSLYTYNPLANSKAYANIGTAVINTGKSIYTGLPNAYNSFINTNEDKKANILGQVSAPWLVSQATGYIINPNTSLTITKAREASEATKALGLADELKTSIWKLNQIDRGLQAEIIQGANLPKNFPVIDRLNNNIATSIKSIDLTASSYNEGNGLYNKLKDYIDKLDSFTGGKLNGFEVKQGDNFTRKAIEVIVEPQKASLEQINQLNKAMKYAQEHGIDFNIVYIK